MNVILISECHKKAARDSRRILSKYARHIARRTWIASITKKGLAHLQQELLQIATKNSAIACHKIINRHDIALVWIVGSHKAFDEEGNFAFRYTEDISERYHIDLSDKSRELMRFLSYLNKLAGLFHDVGKNFYYFQDKLIQNKKGTAAGDPIRHEYLSFLCFFYLFDFEKSDYAEQLLGVKEKIATLDFNHLQGQIATEENMFGELFKQDDAEFILVKLLSHLILSHHRLISGKENNNKIILIDNDYFNKVYDKLNKKDTIFQLYKDQSFILCNQEWKNQCNIVIDRLIEGLKQADSALLKLIKTPQIFLSLGHYVLRPALIMADQRASAYLSKINENERTKASYAQQTAIANSLNNGQLNQSLKEHLGWVGKESFKINKIVWQSILSRKRLYTTPASEKIKRSVPQSLKPFQWQNTAVNAIKQQCFPESFGFFAVVMAQTGAGKTQLNAKIMAALNPDLRFSTLLGLRTLTLQTLDEYNQHLGINKQHILGIIGDKNTRLLHEADKDNKKQEKQEKDNEEEKETSTLSALFKEEETLDITKNLFKDVDTPFPEEFCFYNKKDSKLDAITKIPVLVATIDYMIRGIETNSSSKTRFLLRLMTSDLIIDEIDSYNKNDLMAIHKLVYLVGFYGNKLIISSATLPELLIKSFYLAYSTGYQRFCHYADKQQAPLYMGLFTHIESLNQVTLIKEKLKEKATAIITPFIDKFYTAIQQQKVKRRATILDISNYLHSDVNKNDPQHEILAPLYQTIFNASETLHKSNYTLIDGIKVSTGLIKFNNTVDAFHCAHYLLTEPELEANAIIKIECYHARHFPIRRNYAEKVLSQLLNRKKSKKGNRFKELTIVKNAIKAAKNQNKKQVILLVVSTTIIEIGRDFDFDWGIIEPSSHWSIIQTTGRIMRHREKNRCDNVVLLSHSMKAIRSAKNNRLIYTLPGPETSQYRLNTDDKYKSVEALFEYKQLKQKIDASITLKNTQGNPIKNLENQQIEHFITDKAIGSLHSYLNHPLEYLSTFNTEQNPFRGKYQPQTIYQQDEHYHWHCIDKRKKTTYSVDNIETIHLNNLAQKRSLLSKSLEEIEADYAKKGIELPREIISPTTLENTKKYNEFLGML